MSTPEPRERTGDPRVLAAAATTVILWASAFIVIRGTASAFTPGPMALLRMLVGSLALGVIAARAGIRLPPRSSVPLLIAWGVAWFAGYNLALNAAERLIDAGAAATIVNIAPLLVVVLAGLLLGEGFPPGLVVGAPLSFLGVALIGLPSSSGHVGALGAGLAFVAAVLYAGATLVQKHLLRTVDATTLTWLGAVAGTVALLPWAGALLAELRTATPAAIAGVVYLGLFPTAVAFTTWAYVLVRSSAGRTSATTYVVPAVSILLAWVLLDERPTPLILLGAGLCLLGVHLTRTGRR